MLVVVVYLSSGWQRKSWWVSGREVWCAHWAVLAARPAPSPQLSQPSSLSSYEASPLFSCNYIHCVCIWCDVCHQHNLSPRGLIRAWNVAQTPGVSINVGCGCWMLLLDELVASRDAGVVPLLIQKRHFHRARTHQKKRFHSHVTPLHNGGRAWRKEGESNFN